MGSNQGEGQLEAFFQTLIYERTVLLLIMLLLFLSSLPTHFAKGIHPGFTLSMPVKRNSQRYKQQSCISTAHVDVVLYGGITLLVEKVNTGISLGLLRSPHLVNAVRFSVPLIRGNIASEHFT